MSLKLISYRTATQSNKNSPCSVVQENRATMPQLQAKLLQERRLPVKGAEIYTQYHEGEGSSDVSRYLSKSKSLIFGKSCEIYEIFAHISID